MPSRSNPNVPTSVKNRARSRRAGIKASVKSRGPRRVEVLTDPNQPVTESGSGVHRKKTNSSKAVRKIARRSNYATKRKEIEVDEVRKAGEGGTVEMTDISILPLSRRQEKLIARAAAVAEANAKTAEARETEAAEKAAKGVIEAEAVMDID